MDPVFAVAIFVVIFMIIAGLIGGVMSSGTGEGHHHGIVSRIIDWMF